jgi:hypothetical protein
LPRSPTAEHRDLDRRDTGCAGCFKSVPPLIRLASLFVFYLDQRRKRKGALHRFGRSLGLDAIIVVRSRPEMTLGRTLFDAAA